MRVAALNTLFIGRNLIREKSISSTNSYLSELNARTALPEGTIVISDFQNSGRGQTGTSWISEPGQNLLLSVLLKPDFISAKKFFILSKAVSLAIKDALEEYDIHARIKWPNDIYAGSKKICGVLIENSIKGERVQYSIVGIGLNVNQETFPSEIPNPISMKLIKGLTYSIDEVLSSVCNHLEKRCLELKALRINNINKEYLESLYGLNETLSCKTINNENENFQGRITDVEDEGFIVLRKDDGSTTRFSFKEIIFFPSGH